ncbi:MAG: hypothetical protein QOG03_931, partial [Actinomycetota bacterium]|nr:hypothetical protein [Actinomycetota bacterium]
MARVVRVLPDVPAIDKEFDYVVPPAIEADVRVGTVVRVELHGRRVGGWVVADDVSPIEGVALRPLAKVTGWGPADALIELARWSAWRWAGRPATFLKAASAPGAVRALPAPARSLPRGGGNESWPARSVLRLPPTADRVSFVLDAASRGPCLVLAPSVSDVERLAARLRRAGARVAVLPRDWALATAGADVVVGARAGAWGPCHDLATGVVLDAHDEAYQDERAPTWNAWQVVAERCRRADVPCRLVSPCPTLDQLAWAGEPVTPERAEEYAGWPTVEVADRRSDDPRLGLMSEPLTRLLRGEGRVVCVLNRKGRARLLACTTCGVVVACERCGSAVEQVGEGTAAALRCRRCQTVRPVVCQSCGGGRMKNLRPGVARLAEEL